MTTQDIIDKILAKNPEISQEQILEKLQAEKTRTGGLLGDETLLRLIAAKYGVEVQQNIIQIQWNLIDKPLVCRLKRCYGGRSVNRGFSSPKLRGRETRQICHFDGC